MDVEIKRNEPYLQGISFEVKAGELLAIMSTTGKPFSSLYLNVIFNDYWINVLHFSQ